MEKVFAFASKWIFLSKFIKADVAVLTGQWRQQMTDLGFTIMVILMIGISKSQHLAPELDADGQPPVAALPGQLCCQWILLYLVIYTVATEMLNFVGRLCCRAFDWSAEAACLAEAGFRVIQSIITHYIIITSLLPQSTCYDSTNGFVITYLCIITTSLLRINTPHYITIACYYCTNGPLLLVVTVIMDPSMSGMWFSHPFSWLLH